LSNGSLRRQKVKEDAVADENVLPFTSSLLPFQVAWLSLDDNDNHLGQFLAYLIATFISGFTGSHAYVFDYLADEVFQRQPNVVRTFLMQTAILTRLCGPLCAAVTGQDDAQTLLEHLEQANLFSSPWTATGAGIATITCFRTFYANAWSARLTRRAVRYSIGVRARGSSNTAWSPRRPTMR
jgi:ATP/maltotriose-dependent transcriptional regulator MalT